MSFRRRRNLSKELYKVLKYVIRSLLLAQSRRHLRSELHFAELGFINKSFVTPVGDLGEKIKGKVFVSFVVEKDGTLSDIRILRDIGYGTGQEAVRVLKLMPKWAPGIQNGREIRCTYTIPISVPQ